MVQSICEWCHERRLCNAETYVDGSVNHTEMTLVAVSIAHVSTVLKLAAKLPTLKVIVAMAEIPAEEKKIYQAWGEQVGIKVMDLPERKRSNLLAKRWDSQYA